MSSIIYLTDRSRIVQRENCERSRFLNYDFDINGTPTGLQRKTASLPLLNGIELHEAHARVLGGEPVDDVVKVINARYREQVESRGVHGEGDPQGLIREQTALLEGLLRVFVKLWVPRILEEYSIVTIEKAMDWHLAPGLVQKLRFDVVLRRNGDNQLVILDYKSMAYISEMWAKKLERSRQTSLYILAAQELFGESVEIAYLGLVKGMWRKDTAKSSPFYETKIQSTPLLYVYELAGELGSVYETEWTAKKGFKKVRTYEAESIPGGMKEWVEWLWQNQRAKLNEMFTFNPPFAPTPREMHRVKELVVREELTYLRRIVNYRQLRDKALATGNEQLAQQAQDYLDFVAAPMREERCHQYGTAASVCQFHDGICFNAGGLDTALEDGEYEPREAHHSTELEEVA